MQRLLDVNEAAELIHASPFTVRSWIRKGRLAAVRVGRLVRIEPCELEKLVTRGKQVAPCSVESSDVEDKSSGRS